MYDAFLQPVEYSVLCYYHICLWRYAVVNFIVKKGTSHEVSSFALKHCGQPYEKSVPPPPPPPDLLISYYYMFSNSFDTYEQFKDLQAFHEPGHTTFRKAIHAKLSTTLCDFKALHLGIDCLHVEAVEDFQEEETLYPLLGPVKVFNG